MNDRFKFRAIFNVTYTGDNKEEIEIKVIINDVGIHHNLGVCFQRDDLINIIDKLNITEEQKEEIIEHFDDNNSCTDDEFFWIWADGVDQCTELPDKNGKLIYEGDVIKNDRYIFEVKFGEEYVETGAYEMNTTYQLGFYVYNPFDKESPFESFPVNNNDYEIIGNIRENPELLEVQDA